MLKADREAKMPEMYDKMETVMAKNWKAKIRFKDMIPSQAQTT